MTSHGSYVLDMTFDRSLDAKTLNDLISNTPGVVEHGIFYWLNRCGIYCSQRSCKRALDLIYAMRIYSKTSAIQFSHLMRLSFFVV